MDLIDTFLLYSELDGCQTQLKGAVRYLGQVYLNGRLLWLQGSRLKWKSMRRNWEKTKGKWEMTH